MNIYSKLTSVQAELKAPKGQYNSFGKYKYRSAEDILEAVKPLLKKHGLTQVINDEIVGVNDRYYIRATVTIFDETGNALSTTALAREPETKKGMDEPQITGASSSYARKYALNGMYAIDDTKDTDTDEYHQLTQSEPVSKGKKDDKQELINEIGVIAKSRGLTQEGLQKAVIKVTGTVIKSADMSAEQLKALRDELLKLE